MLSLCLSPDIEFPSLHQSEASLRAFAPTPRASDSSWMGVGEPQVSGFLNRNDLGNPALLCSSPFQFRIYSIEELAQPSGQGSTVRSTG